MESLSDVLLLQDGIVGTDVVLVSYKKGVDFVRHNIGYIFKDTEKLYFRWITSTWSQKIQRVSMEENGTELVKLWLKAMMHRSIN